MEDVVGLEPRQEKHQFFMDLQPVSYGEQKISFDRQATPPVGGAITCSRNLVKAKSVF